ncbi:MAG: EpsG family protein [Bacteroidales bacterium]|nr:EpsG family protein [Bacteroidales bacterium]
MAKIGGESKWYYFNLVVLILLAGLRYRVGGDTLMYMSVFEECPTLDELKYFDFDTAQYNPLWYIFNAVSKSIYDDFFFFQLIHACIVNPIFFSFFRKYCPNYYFSVILLYYVGYFCYFNMEVLRESLCICVLLLVTRFLLEKRWLPYYVMCVLALFMHYSALVMFLFPLLFVFFKRPSWVYQVILLVGIFVFTAVVNVPMLLLSALSVDEQLMVLAEKYLDKERNLMGMLSLLLQYLPLLGMIFLRERYNIRQKIDFTPIVMGVVVIYAFSLNLTGLNRLVNYFIPFILIYTVNTIYYVVSRVEVKFSLGYTALAASLSLLCFNYYYYYAKDVSDAYPNTRFYTIFYPYHSVFSPEQDEHRERFIENYRDVVIQF